MRRGKSQPDSETSESSKFSVFTRLVKAYGHQCKNELCISAKDGEDQTILALGDYSQWKPQKKDLKLTSSPSLPGQEA